MANSNPSVPPHIQLYQRAPQLENSGIIKGMAGALSDRQPRRMSKAENPFRYFRSSSEKIRSVVMLYVRFPLSLRNVEGLLFERGYNFCHETVRLWWSWFGPMFAAEMRRRRVHHVHAFRHWQWHLGEMAYLRRTINHEGDNLESYVTKKGDISAALAFMKKALKRHGRTEAIIADGLLSYKAGMREPGNQAK